MTDLVKVKSRESLIRGQDVPRPQKETIYTSVPVQTGEDEIDIRSLFLVLHTRKWLILLVILAIVVPVGLYSFLATPLYRSMAQIQIDPESTQVLPYKEVGDAPVSDYEVYLKTQYEILKSPSLATRVVDEMNLTESATFNASTGIGLNPLAWISHLVHTIAGKPPEKTTPDQEEVQNRTVNRLLANLEVNPVRASRLVQVSYVSVSPKFSADIVNAVAEEFMKRHFEKKYETTEKATNFLRNQLEILKVKVEEAERELIDYARAHGILNLEEKDEDVIVKRLEALNARITEIEGKYFEKRAAYEALDKATVEDFPEGLKSQGIEELESKQYELQQRLANLTSTFDEAWPQVIETKQEIARVTEQLQDEKRETLVEAKRQARLEFETAQQEYSMLSSALEQQRTMADRLNEASIQYNILQREVETNKELYQGLLQRLKQAGVSAGLEFGNIELVDRGRVESSPYRPRKTLNLALALILGLTMGCGLAFFLEYMDNSVRSLEDVESFGVPVLSLVPSFDPKELGGEGKKSKQGRLGGSTTLALSKKPKTKKPQSGWSYQVAPMGKENWKTWEAFRNLRTSLLLSKGDKPPSAITVTSSVPREGKTTTVAHLGIMLAQTGARTVIVDLDMRKPALGGLFGMNGMRPGASVLLSGNCSFDKILNKTEVSDLFLIPAGPKPPNPSELLSSERLRDLISVLQEHFDFVLLDTPPALTVTDALIVAPKTDGVILVVRAGETPRDLVQRSRTQLQRVGATILGATVNAVDLDSPEYSYYDHYYYDESYDNNPY